MAGEFIGGTEFSGVENPLFFLIGKTNPFEKRGERIFAKGSCPGNLSLVNLRIEIREEERRREI